MTGVTERTSEPPRLRVRLRARELYGYREILWNLVRKELKVKYTASVLGAVWSLLNPVVFLAVFTLRRRRCSAARCHDYPPFLLVGAAGVEPLLRVAVQRRAVGDREREPREEGLLPPGDPAAGHGRGVLVDFVLQSAVLFLFLIVFGYGFQLDTVWLYPLAFVDLLLFSVALTMFVSSLNVRYRDVQHLIGLALLVWFWLTPIVYPVGKRPREHVESTNSLAILLERLPAEPDDLGRDRVPEGAVPFVGPDR